MSSSVERFEDRILDELAGWSSPSQGPSGFRVRIDLADLAAALEARHPAVTDVVESHPGWHLELELALADAVGGGGTTWRTPVTTWDRRWTGNDLELSPLHDGKRVVPVHSAARGLHFHLFEPRVVASAARLDRRDLHLVVASSDGAPVTEFTISCGRVGLRRSFPAVPVEGGWAATLSVPPLPSGASPTSDHQWGVRAVVAGESCPIMYAGSTGELSRSSPHTGGLRLGLVGSGRLRMLDRKLHATVHAVEVADDLRSFTVTGYAAEGRGTGAFPRARVQPERLEAPTACAKTACRVGSRPTSTSPRAAGAAPSPWGRVATRCACCDGPASSSAASGSRSPRTRSSRSAQSFLHWHQNADVAFRFTLTSRARALWVNTRSAVPEQDWTRAGRWAAHRGIPALLSSPIEDAVLFSTFGGRSAGDSPLALHDELVRRDYPYRLIWEVVDGTAVVPDGAVTVVIGSREHLRALHTSRHLVANNNFPFYYSKHPDQKYLQTWHGTPLKKIGQHVPAPNLSLSYRDLMSREAKAWDLLLAQNDFASTTLPEALEYDGEVLNLGYPRNDLLSTGSDADRARVRARLGLPPGRTDRALRARPGATTCAPRRVATRMVNHLDLDRVSQAFGGGSVLLVRGHSNTPGLGDVTAANVVDVSRYPDITELMLVADVLITDYSSMMFDFASTGRPMLFLTPDLAEYAGSTRGFYLDFTEIAPGPLLESTDDVLRSLTSLAQLETAYSRPLRRIPQRLRPARRRQGVGACRGRGMGAVTTAVVGDYARAPIARSNSCTTAWL